MPAGTHLMWGVAQAHRTLLSPGGVRMGPGQEAAYGDDRRVGGYGSVESTNESLQTSLVGYRVPELSRLGDRWHPWTADNQLSRMYTCA